MKTNSHIVSGILIILLGVLVSISVYFINYDYYHNSLDFIKTECIIDKIDIDKHTTTVIYEVEGEKLTKKLNLYDSSFKVGTKTDIYYDKEEPIKSYLQCEVTLFNMLISLGLIIVATGLYFIISYFFKRRHYIYLKENGKKIKASIASIDSKKFLSIFPYHPSYICATAKVEGNQYNFLSETIYSNSIKYIKDKKVKNVNVYINENDIGDYYVDISFINPKM